MFHAGHHPLAETLPAVCTRATREGQSGARIPVSRRNGLVGTRAEREIRNEERREKVQRDAIEVRKAERHSEQQHQTVLVREQAAAAGRRFRLPPASDASEAITREVLVRTLTNTSVPGLGDRIARGLASNQRRGL